MEPQKCVDMENLDLYLNEVEAFRLTEMCTVAAAVREGLLTQIPAEGDATFKSVQYFFSWPTDSPICTSSRFPYSF
jgi:hypothetical protein